jgi:hypothetical protein
VEPEETVVARQRLDKHVSAAMDVHTTIDELLEASYSVWSVPRAIRKS